jgi:uncharacterized protein (UPF0261 family)
MTKTIVIVGTLDTKGEEVKYIQGLIAKRGHRTIVIDTGVLGQTPFTPDITRDQVAGAANTSLKEVIALGEEGKAIAVMAEGTAKVAQELYSSGNLDGIIALGGSMGTSLAMPLMNALPLLTPKLLVSTVAFSRMIPSDVVSKDLTVMPTVVDIWGLNRITKRVLQSAAGAIAGMVEEQEKEEVAQKPLIGVTTLGTSGMKHVLWAKPLLEQKGYEVAVFHTNGIGGMTFEEFVEQGLLAGALDLSLAELGNYLCGGHPAVDRLEAIGKRALPQVVAPGALNWFSWFGSLETIPAKYRRRKTYMHNPLVMELKTSKKEMAAMGEVIARKLNRALGPTVFLIPTRGFSSRDELGAPFYDPQARKALISALKRNIEPKIEVIELDMHLNDPAFAQEAVSILDSMMRKWQPAVP